MADKIPLHYQYSSTDTVGLSEYQAGEKINFSYINAVSGTDFKTLNSTSILGSGDISVQPTLVSGTNIRTINGSSLLGSGDISISGSGGSTTGESFHPFLLIGA